MRAGTLIAALALSALAAGGTTFAEDGAELVAEQPAGVIDATGYSRLEILGLRGAVSVRAGRPGDLRFMCRDLKTRREERAAALWIDDRTLILGPGEGLEEERLLCETVVPPNLSVVVEIDGGKVVVNNLANDIEIHGSDVDVEARALNAGIELDLVGGKVRLYGVAEGVEIEGKDLDVLAQDVDGFVELSLAGGKADIRNVKGGVNADLERVVLAVESVEGQFELSADGGELALAALHGGGNIVLSDTRMTLSAAKGAFDIDTNADVELRDMHGDVRLHADGGKVAALGSAGNLNIEAYEAEVSVERIAGNTVIVGDQLRLQLRELGGGLNVSTTGSQIVVAGTDGTVGIQNDFGDVVIAKAVQAVNIKNQQGSVRVTQLAAPVQLEVDGPEVTVHWIDTSHGKDSTVENTGGTVTLMFSHKGGGRVEAHSRHGQIQGNLAGIDIADDGKTAQGNVNRLGRPKVKVVSDGDLFLNQGPRVSPGGRKNSGTAGGGKKPGQ